MTTIAERVAREDLLSFVGASFACTGQREFYSDGRGQAVSLQFLHEYVRGNYRHLYARMLACGINEHNQAEIIFGLLSTGQQVRPEHREEEGALIFRALERLPPQRAMRLLDRLARARVNNRRTRAIIKRYLQKPEARDFRAVKYRRRFRAAAIHAHLPFEGELASFFVHGHHVSTPYRTPIFESYRRAHFGTHDGLWQLPFTVAEGLARRFEIPREVFLSKIQGQLTTGERLRLQRASSQALGEAVSLDPERLTPTRLASWILSHGREVRAARAGEFAQLLTRSATAAVARTGARFGKVAAVLDRSWSTSGSSEKLRRPLAVALATSAYLRAASADYHAFWTAPTSEEVLVEPLGATNLADPILRALELRPDLLVIVSDGFENDPPGVAGDLVESARDAGILRDALHVNPVFDEQSLGPRALHVPRATDGEAGRFVLPTMGIRDAEDLPTVLAFGAFASTTASLAELEATLRARVVWFLGHGSRAEGPTPADEDPGPSDEQDPR